MIIHCLKRKDTGETAYYQDPAIAQLEQANYREQMGVECEITEAILDERGALPATSTQPNVWVVGYDCINYVFRSEELAELYAEGLRQHKASDMEFVSVDKEPLMGAADLDRLMADLTADDPDL